MMKKNESITTNIRYSIIVPHYDIPHLLERLLNTIPEREDMQIIVVDDCSPGSDTYLEKYAFLRRSNVEFHITEKNGGGGYARNEGLKHAIGKWLLFADADDLFADDFCSILDRYYHDEDDIITFRIKSVYSENLSRASNRDIDWNPNCQNYLHTGDDSFLRYKLTEVWSKMIRKEIVTRNNVWFDETKVFNDYFFSIQIGYYAHKVKLGSDVIYILTQRNNSVSNGGWVDSIENLKVRLDVTVRVQSFLHKRKITLKPMPIRGLMVLALKNCPLTFLKTLLRLHKQKLPIMTLIWQMFFYASGNRRKC